MSEGKTNEIIIGQKVCEAILKPEAFVLTKYLEDHDDFGRRFTMFFMRRYGKRESEILRFSYRLIALTQKYEKHEDILKYLTEAYLQLRRERGERELNQWRKVYAALRPLVGTVPEIREFLLSEVFDNKTDGSVK